MPASSLRPVRVDLQRAAAIVHSVSTRDAAPGRRARFERLAEGGFFDLTPLDRLRPLALSAWFVRHQQVEAVAMRSQASVSPEVATQAQEARTRMLRVLEYHFDDDPTVARRLAYIRSGTGYQDLANDLFALAEMYEAPELAMAIAVDGKRYRVDDASEARRLATELFAGLGLVGPSDAARWNDLAQRIWTLLSTTYDEVRAAGLFLFRNEDGVAASYPSLFTATRAGGRSRAEEPEEEEPAEDEEGEVVLEPEIPVEV